MVRQFFINLFVVIVFLLITIGDAYAEEPQPLTTVSGESVIVTVYVNQIVVEVSSGEIGFAPPSVEEFIQAIISPDGTHLLLAYFDGIYEGELSKATFDPTYTFTRIDDIEAVFAYTFFSDNSMCIYAGMADGDFEKKTLMAVQISYDSNELADIRPCEGVNDEILVSDTKALERILSYLNQNE